MGRDRYRCARCAQPTLRCRLCDDMARGRPDALPEELVARMRGLFGDALCADITVHPSQDAQVAPCSHVVVEGGGVNETADMT